MWKIFFSNKFIFKIVNEFENIYIYSPSLRQDLSEITSSNYIPFNIIPNIFNEENIDLESDEKVIDKEKSDTEIETCESIEELKFPQEPDDGVINILDDLNEKKWTTLGWKQCLNNLDMITYLISYSAKNSTNYPKNNMSKWKYLHQFQRCSKSYAR